MNAADCVVTGTRQFDRDLTCLLHSELHWLDVLQRVQYRLGVMVHRCLQDRAPKYLIDCCIPTSDIASRHSSVVSVSDLPLAISWSYHVIVAVGSDVGHSSWQVRWSGNCCLIISVIHRSASDLFDQHWRHSFSQCTRTRSAVEALCVMRYTSRQ